MIVKSELADRTLKYWRFARVVRDETSADFNRAGATLGLQQMRHMDLPKKLMFRVVETAALAEKKQRGAA